MNVDFARFRISHVLRLALCALNGLLLSGVPADAASAHLYVSDPGAHRVEGFVLRDGTPNRIPDLRLTIPADRTESQSGPTAACTWSIQRPIHSQFSIATS